MEWVRFRHKNTHEGHEGHGQSVKCKNKVLEGIARPGQGLKWAEMILAPGPQMGLRWRASI